MNNKQFKNKIRLAKRYLDKSLDILFISFFGSYNYGLETLTSDIDMKVVYVPTLDDLIARVPETETIKIDCGLLDKISLPAYVKELNDFELSGLEILFCKYMWINPKYEKLVNELKNIMIKVLVKNKKLFVGIVSDTMKKIYNRFVNNCLIAYNGKKAYNIPRLQLLLDNVLVRDEYNLIVESGKIDEILKYKRGIVKKDEAVIECMKIIDEVEKLKDKYVDEDRFYQFDAKLNSICREVIKNNINKMDSKISINEIEEEIDVVPTINGFDKTMLFVIGLMGLVLMLSLYKLL